MTEEPTIDLGQQAEEPALDTAQLQYLRDKLKSDQNLGLGILTGAIAALVGALLWAGITVATGWQIGFMAVGVGFLVGYVIRVFGRGVDKVFGIVGALSSLTGCVVGNLLAVCGMIAKHNAIPFLSVLQELDTAVAVELVVANFSPMDLLFYGIATWEGYKLSFRQISEQDLQRMLKGTTESAF